MLRRLSTWGCGSLDRLQEGADPSHRCWTRLSPSAEIEYETRISHCIAAEPRWRGLAPIQELLDFT
jgi:hypothetical protein